MKFLGFVCFVLVLEGVLSAGVLKRDVPDKNKDEEDVYGMLDEGNGDVQKDQVDYYTDIKDDDEAEESPPESDSNNVLDAKLVSKPETFVQELGSVVRLPCQASTKGDELIRVWSKDSTPIYQGSINIANKKNYKLLPQGDLEVILEDPEDYGIYSCKLAISDNDQPEILHKIVQKSSPEITALYTKENKKVYDLGETVTLVCQAGGFPKPKVSWHKNNERIGTTGETLIIQNLKPRHAGNYRCLADNDVGRPAHKNIEVIVNHAPMVTVDKYIQNSAHESDLELVCEVKAYPAPVVNWQRDGQNIVTHEPKIKLQREKNNERNVLKIKNIGESDFGQYSCVATNSLGKQVKTINVVKTPVVAKFEKNHSNETLNDVILQWRVESKQPVSEHQLQYRKKGETNWNTITPEVGAPDNDVYLIKHTLKNLEPGVYETRARSRNSHGWSPYSEIIPFEGDLSSAHDTPAQHRSEEALAVGESTKDSSTAFSSSIALIAFTLLTLQLRH